MSLQARPLALHSNHELREELRRLGAPPEEAAAAFEAAFVQRILVQGLSGPRSRKLAESFRQAGGTAVVGTRGRLLLVGTPAVFHPFQDGLNDTELADRLRGALHRSFPVHRRPLQVGPLTLEWGGQTHVMGIINLTPDSFSGDGILARFPGRPVEKAVALARQMIEAGAHLVDIGGESSRPGAEPVGGQEERRRVLPVIEALARQAPEIPISIDTYRAGLAQAALAAGAHLVNDVWAMERDPRMAEVVAAAGAPIILMHNRSDPKRAAYSRRLGGHYPRAGYVDLLGEIAAALEERVAAAVEAGIDAHRIVLDPGIGFGKTPAQSMLLLDRLEELRALGHPLLVGPSRKSFIGYVLDLPPEERLEGTAAAVAVAIVRGADIVRVHDVGAMARVARMTDALVRR